MDATGTADMVDGVEGIGKEGEEGCVKGFGKGEDLVQSGERKKNIVTTRSNVPHSENPGS